MINIKYARSSDTTIRILVLQLNKQLLLLLRTFFAMTLPYVLNNSHCSTYF